MMLSLHREKISKNANFILKSRQVPVWLGRPSEGNLCPKPPVIQPLLQRFGGVDPDLSCLISDCK